MTSVAMALAGCHARAIALTECDPGQDCAPQPRCSEPTCPSTARDTADVDGQVDYADGGVDAARRIDFTFDDSVEGWWLNTWADPDSLNLTVFSPEGAALPSLEFSAATGRPSAGALVMTGHFTAPGQFVDAIVDPDPTSDANTDLSGRWLSVWVRLASGSAPDINFYVSSTSDYIYQGLYIESESLVPGEWTKLELDLTTRQDARFDPTQVILIGVQIVSANPDAEPVVLEIDSVRGHPSATSAE